MRQSCYVYNGTNNISTEDDNKSCLCVPEIAASFAKGVHFNTFGGNPVACAVASSVLDVRIHLIFDSFGEKVQHD